MPFFVPDPQSSFPALRCLLALVACLGVVCISAAARAGSRPADDAVLRCGWFENPTPGNASLTDRDAEWTIGLQGGHQAEGDWPVFGAKQWVATNRSYGYGCACMRVVADAGRQEIQRILSAQARPLATCRRDPALKEPRPGR